MKVELKRQETRDKKQVKRKLRTKNPVPGAGPVSVPARPAPDRVEERALHGDRIFCMNFVVTYCYPLLKKGPGKEC